MTKNLHSIDSIRKAVLASCRGKVVLNIFNRERFGRFTTPAHVAALLGVVKRLKVLHISRKETIDPRLVPLLKTGKLEVRFLTPKEYPSKTEILVTDDRVFAGDGIDHWVIENEAFADDMKDISRGHWEMARPSKAKQFRLHR